LGYYKFVFPPDYFTDNGGGRRSETISYIGGVVEAGGPSHSLIARLQGRDMWNIVAFVLYISILQWNESTCVSL